MKNIIISGAGRGIGFQLVQTCLKDENNFVWVLTRNITAFSNLAPSIKARLKVIEFDITNFSEEHLLNTLSIDKADILVNNAGYLVNKPFIETQTEDWQKIFNTNFFGAIKLIKTLLPLLEKSAQAHIVNIGSMGGFQGSAKFTGLSAYSSSKGALALLTECLAEEFKQSNYKIACNCLCLGSVNTEMLQEAFPGYVGSNSPEEISQLIYLFATEGFKFFNGKILPVSTSTP